ncbi:MAG: adenosylmethionine--8-amino-7-oxononanoate transaminase [Mariprofundales bacterium]|nr:adenosylmethionine--8-amino-7-oxononanoate transaminase [Mariprofundales bacterium]
MTTMPHHDEVWPDLLVFDRDHLWHPYAPMPSSSPVYPVVAAQGSRLQLANGNWLIDGMSSWWCAIHGYGVSELDAALAEQAGRMSHVMFGGLTHAPAVKLGARLLALAPKTMESVFFADSGSVAVEVALKMALQFWQSQGQPQRSRMLTIRHGYHGDTLGAMGVCDPEGGMHQLFHNLLPQHYFADAPASDAWHPSQLDPMRSLLEDHGDKIAAVIMEPVVQGAGGMRFHAPEFVRGVRGLCDDYGVLLILDEIATGFGRTGTMFACEQAGIAPDILCLGKALTGGYMTLAATLTNAKVRDGIAAGETPVLMHGPTFMANPLACAVACASIDLLCASSWQQRVAAIEAQLRQELAPCRKLAAVADVRVKGAIGVIEMRSAIDVAKVQSHLIAQGVWLRPFGKLLYTMPPYVITPDELGQVTCAMCEVAACC